MHTNDADARCNYLEVKLWLDDEYDVNTLATRLTSAMNE